MFLDLVANLTQKQLSGQAWIDKISEDTEDLLARERQVGWGETYMSTQSA